jgi:2-phosphosulfolactate phosphatase
VFVLEDALGAGAIVDAALVIDPALFASDAARFARDGFAISRARIGEAVLSAYHAQELIDAGLGEDVAYCGQLDTSAVVPLLERADGGVLMLRGWFG